MIVFVYGTSAEAIKVAPLARRLTERGIPYEQWLTMQHGTALVDVSTKLGFTGEVTVLPNGNGGRALKTMADAAKWLISVMLWFVTNRRRKKKRLGEGSIVIVHGDTMTTVVGTVFAKLLGLPSAHVEAGLRSGDWRNPFPEELDRIIAGYLATIHYVPTEEAVRNLAKRDNVVYTHGNTVIDAVLDAPTGDAAVGEPYGICLLHRFELLSNREAVEETLRVVGENSPIPVRLFLDEFSSSVLGEFLPTDGKSTLRPEKKLPYTEFIDVLRNAAFVITDSGGIQAESAQLGVPALIHRKTTEQWEGFGENLVLSKLDSSIVEKFLTNYSELRRPTKKPAISPTGVVLDDLEKRGFLKGAQR